MKYTVHFFRESFPAWKKKRDPIMVRFLYRPISFYFSALFANLGLSGNDVSNISTVVGIIACAVLLIPNHIAGLLGALLINFWIILDCTDGNIARSVKKLAYGEFIDATSSYILMALLFNVLGFRSYYTSGLLFVGNPIIIFIGALASSFDPLMRLVYQKYVVVSDKMNIHAEVNHDPTKVSKIDRIRIFVDLNMSVGGFLPIVLLLGIAFGFLDIIVIIWAFYLGAECTVTILYLLIKATRYGKSHKEEINESTNS